MKIKFNKYPIDIIICLFLSFIILPIILFDINYILRVLISIPFIFFIPGYSIIFFIFPNNNSDDGFDVSDRIVLSFGISIAVAPIIGLILNYSPWGIHLESILSSLILLIYSFGLLGIYRWLKLDSDERFIIKFRLISKEKEQHIDIVLKIVIIIITIITISSLVYVLTVPKIEEASTEFYILDPNDYTIDYPRYIKRNENSILNICIENHEYRTIDYTIEIWLLNQTILYNDTILKYQINYNHMYFIDKNNIELNHQSNSIKNDIYCWDYNLTISNNISGRYKLVFLLDKDNTEDYDYFFDYKDIADEIINKSYRENHIWLDISKIYYFIINYFD